MRIRPISLQLLPALLLFLMAGSSPLAAEGESEFSRTSVDIGIAVGDVEQMVNFYTEAIGFRKIDGFSMSGTLARNIGLTAGTPLDVRVLVLGEGRSATRLKLIALPRTDATLQPESASGCLQGFRFITIFVADIDRALNRLDEAGAEPAANGPVRLGRNSPHEVFVMLVRDPEGNLIELVGPRNNVDPSE